MKKFIIALVLSINASCIGVSEEMMYVPRILKVTKMGDPILGRPAKQVEDPSNAEVRRIVEDMLATANDMSNCAGLAAPQVSIPLRIVLISVPAQKGGEEIPLTVLINPTWEPISQEQEEDYEGCLSIPGLMGPVVRFKNIRYTFQTIEGKKETKEASGFHARVVQHECDHLDGKLYPSKMSDISRFAYVEEVAKHTPRR